MRKSLGLIATAITVCLPFSAMVQADDNFYIGANLIRVTDDGDEAPAIYPLAIGVKAGVELLPNVALEARYASGVKSDSANVSGVKVDLEVDDVYGAYVKGILPFESCSPYLLVGYTHGQETAKVKAFGLSQSDSDSSFSYGIGIDVPVSKTISINAEWARLLKGEDDAGVGYKIEGLSIGAAMRF